MNRRDNNQIQTNFPVNYDNNYFLLKDSLAYTPTKEKENHDESMLYYKTAVTNNNITNFRVGFDPNYQNNQFRNPYADNNNYIQQTPSINYNNKQSEFNNFTLNDKYAQNVSESPVKGNFNHFNNDPFANINSLNFIDLNNDTQKKLVFSDSPEINSKKNILSDLKNAQYYRDDSIASEEELVKCIRSAYIVNMMQDSCNSRSLFKNLVSDRNLIENLSNKVFERFLNGFNNRNSKDLFTFIVSLFHILYINNRKN